MCCKDLYVDSSRAKSLDSSSSQNLDSNETKPKHQNVLNPGSQNTKVSPKTERLQHSPSSLQLRKTISWLFNISNLEAKVLQIKRGFGVGTSQKRGLGIIFREALGSYFHSSTLLLNIGVVILRLFQSHPYLTQRQSQKTEMVWIGLHVGFNVPVKHRISLKGQLVVTKPQRPRSSKCIEVFSVT